MIDWLKLCSWVVIVAFCVYVWALVIVAVVS